MYSTTFEHKYKVGDTFWVASEYGDVETFKISKINFLINKDKKLIGYSNGSWTIHSDYMKNCFPTKKEAEQRQMELINELDKNCLQDLEKELEILQKKIFTLKGKETI